MTATSGTSVRSSTCRLAAISPETGTGDTDKVGQVSLAQAKLLAACLQLAEIQQMVDKLQQFAGMAVDGTQLAKQHLVFHRVEQTGQGGDDQRERRAQFMAHIGEETDFHLRQPTLGTLLLLALRMPQIAPQAARHCRQGCNPIGHIGPPRGIPWRQARHGQPGHGLTPAAMHVGGLHLQRIAAGREIIKVHGVCPLRQINPVGPVPLQTAGVADLAGMQMVQRRKGKRNIVLPGLEFHFRLAGGHKWRTPSSS